MYVHMFIQNICIMLMISLLYFILSLITKAKNHLTDNSLLSSPKYFAAQHLLEGGAY